MAEGVEAEEQYRILQALLCDEIQGHHVSRALPADAFEMLVRAWDGRLITSPGTSSLIDAATPPTTVAESDPRRTLH